MKTIVVLAVLVATAVAFEHAEEWELWKTKHGKTYKDDKEELHRRTIWTSSKAFVEEHNKHSDKFGFTVGMNTFADLVGPTVALEFITSLLIIQEATEFSRIYNGYRQDLLEKTRNSFKVAQAKWSTESYDCMS